MQDNGVTDASAIPSATDKQQPSYHEKYQLIRQRSRHLCQPLEIADHELQAAPFTSPAKWHLAHTSWFFETFILKNLKNYQVFHKDFEYLFNSYYNGVGKQYPRQQRGLMSRPSLQEILNYRDHVDHHMQIWINQNQDQENIDLLELGCHHEQQHQELLLTDLLYCWSLNPLSPTYVAQPIQKPKLEQQCWIDFPAGVYLIGKDGEGFRFDNEQPHHKHWLNTFQLSNNPVTNREYLEFINDLGYQRPELWLSDGWTWVQEQKITAPLYWQQQESQWWTYGFNGKQALQLDDLVRHISFYEADAYARWCGLRLPTEFEWEVASSLVGNIDSGLFIENSGLITENDDNLIPKQTATNYKEIITNQPINQLFGSTWEWTSSPYQAYPGYQAANGAVGEYNGKFMCNQMVLRGGSCLTPRTHIRATYRNFFYPHERWQMTGIRLAK